MTATSIDDRLALPQLFDSAFALDEWRHHYHHGLLSIEASIDSIDRANRTALTAIKNTAFPLAYHGQNNRILQSLRGDLLAKAMSEITPKENVQRARLNTPLRVGFVSKHLRDCTVGHYFRRFITDLADERIATYAYACGTADAFTDSLEARVTHPRRFSLTDSDNISETTLVRIATAIAADALDVLIYPEIGMEPLIEKLAAMRLAPLQCAFWGHPDTTGLPTIDVFFSAASMEPQNAQTHYRERLQLLPGLGCAYPTPPPPEPLGREQLGLPNNTPLLVCAQSSFKWRPEFIAAVARILLVQPQVKLVYFANRDRLAELAFKEHLTTRLAEAGVDTAVRIVTLAECSRTRFLAVLAACDLALDTFDFSGGNTTLDALSVGLPVVSLPGEFMRGRQSMAMLQIVGAETLIAQNAEHYARIAVALLDNPHTRHKLRTHLRENVTRLFEDATPINALREWLLAQKTYKTV